MGLYNGSLANYYGGLEDTGSYQFISVTDIINNFRVAYVGEDKIIPKISRADIKFHALRGIQELSYDTFRACKTLELEVPPSLLLLLPHDYVEYTKISWIDSNGKCHPINQCKSCPKDPLSYEQNDDGTINVGTITAGEDVTVTVPAYGTGWNPVYNDEEKRYDDDVNDPRNWDVWNAATTTTTTLGSYYSQDPTVEDSTTWANVQNSGSVNSANNSVDAEDTMYQTNVGQRYGLDPQHANINGCFWINCRTGKIHFDSNLAGKTVTIQYISDGVATDDEMIVHKFAEEAIYKYIAHAVLATRANTPEYQIARFKKEMSAAKRNAKLRMSNLKIAELAQVMRNQSKWIKH